MRIIRPDSTGRFPKVTLPFYGPVALGNGTQWTFSVVPGGNGIVVSIEGRGSYSFGHFVHWTYASEKLGLMQGDAENVADFVNDQLGVEEDVRMGAYTPQLTSDGSTS